MTSPIHLHDLASPCMQSCIGDVVVVVVDVFFVFDVFFVVIFLLVVVMVI